MERIQIWPAVVGMLSLAFAGSALAQCPPQPNDVSVTVEAVVSHDPGSGLYTYSYTLRNAPTSAQSVERFGVDVLEPASGVKSPAGWVNARYRGRSVVVWDALAVTDPDVIPADASLAPSSVQIAPGAALSGFSFQSAKPPGPVRYYVSGYVPLGGPGGADEAEAELAAEQLVEDCPHLRMHVLDVAAVGSTTGPAEFSSATLVIDIKPGSNRNPINPRSRGVVPVAILGAPTFDVTQVDPASVRLGPGQAAPKKGKVHYEDVNRDGVMDALFHFPTPDIGIRCQDTVLFLTGMLRDGTAITGSDSVVTSGCRARK